MRKVTLAVVLALVLPACGQPPTDDPSQESVVTTDPWDQASCPDGQTICNYYLGSGWMARAGFTGCPGTGYGVDYNVNTPTCNNNPTSWNFSTYKTYDSFSVMGTGDLPCSIGGGSTSFTATANEAYKHCATRILNFTEMHTSVYYLSRTSNCVGWVECMTSGIRYY